MISLALLAAAAAVLFWPMKPKPGTESTLDLAAPAPVPVKPTPTYQSAISDLARVRLRLLQTDALDDKTKAAIDALTLALVGGSDK
jgi:hypothetical protein